VTVAIGRVVLNDSAPWDDDVVRIPEGERVVLLVVGAGARGHRIQIVVRDFGARLWHRGLVGAPRTVSR